MLYSDVPSLPGDNQLAAVSCVFALPLAKEPAGHQNSAAGLLLRVRLKGKVGDTQMTQCSH